MFFKINTAICYFCIVCFFCTGTGSVADPGRFHSGSIMRLAFIPDFCILGSSVSDPHWLNADPDPDPDF
jgi:hypothetical protein